MQDTGRLMEKKSVTNKFERLIAWQKAHELVIEIYKITKKFPDTEKFRLVDQLCRSAASVAANLVEGNYRESKKEYLHFLNTAIVSLEETKYHLLLAKDLVYLSVEEYENLIDLANTTGKLIFGLMRNIRGRLVSRI